MALGWYPSGSSQSSFKGCVPPPGPTMSILEKLLLPDIRELIHNKDLGTLQEALNRWEPADIADLLSDLGAHEDIVAFGVLEPSLAAATFAYLSRNVQLELLRVLPEA